MGVHREWDPLLVGWVSPTFVAAQSNIVDPGTRQGLALPFPTAYYLFAGSLCLLSIQRRTV